MNLHPRTRRTVYIETTVPSFYHSTRQSIQALAWRAQTRRWWDNYRKAFDLCTSEAVILELAKAPRARAQARISMLEGVPLLPLSPEVDGVAATYLAHQLMPATAIADAVHVALASVYGADFLLTWNCQHLANANKARHLEVINARLRLHVPRMVTPYNLTPEGAP
jgi:predicted nucleic acid-binding protein